MTAPSCSLFADCMLAGAGTHQSAARKRACKPLQEPLQGCTALRSLLGETNRNLCRIAYRAMAAGNASELGNTLSRAQLAFDRSAAPICPAQLTAPRLHAVLEHKSIQKHIYGGKGVGSQGDGAAQLLCRSANDMREVCNILEGSLDVECMPIVVSAQDRPVQDQ